MASLLDNALHKLTGSLFESGSRVRDNVTVKIATREYSAWQSISVAFSMNALASSFTLNVADKWRQTKESYPIMPGQEVKVFLDTEPVLTGYIEQMSANVSNDDRSITISGRSRTGDLVDSAAIGLRATYKNITLKDLATTYAQDFDVKVIDESRSAAKVFDKVVLNQGETVMELLTRYAKQNNVLLSTNRNSDLLITDRGAGNAAILAGPPPLGQDVRASIGVAPGLYQGENVLFASSAFDETGRFQKYLVKSQIPGSDRVKKEQAAAIEATATDAAVRRVRTKYIIAEKSSNKAQAQARATWEANTSAVKAAKATAIVQGWRDQNGNLWKLNNLVETDLSFIGFAKGQYLIVDTVFTQDKDKGTLTSIGLARADAYSNAEPQVPLDPKKDAGWDTTKFGSLKQIADNIKAGKI